MRSHPLARGGKLASELFALQERIRLDAVQRRVGRALLALDDMRMHRLAAAAPQHFARTFLGRPVRRTDPKDQPAPGELRLDVGGTAAGDGTQQQHAQACPDSTA